MSLDKTKAAGEPQRADATFVRVSRYGGIDSRCAGGRAEPVARTCAHREAAKGGARRHATREKSPPRPGEPVKDAGESGAAAEGKRERAGGERAGPPRMAVPCAARTLEERQSRGTVRAHKTRPAACSQQGIAGQTGHPGLYAGEDALHPTRRARESPPGARGDRDRHYRDLSEPASLLRLSEQRERVLGAWSRKAA